MNVGMRKPSIKKSVSAKTIGKIKRSAKKAVNPMYGKNGMGLVNDPQKALYNNVYSKNTFGVSDLYSTSSSDKSGETIRDDEFTIEDYSSYIPPHPPKFYRTWGNVSLTFSIVTLLFGFLFLFIDLIGIFIILIGLFLLYVGIFCKRTARNIDFGKYENIIDHHDDDN